VTSVALLGGYALLLAVGVPALLLRGDWAGRAPRVALAAWVTAAVTFFATLLLAALSLAAPGVHVSTNLALMLQACWKALRNAYATPAGAALGGIGLTLGLGVLIRVSVCVTRAIRRTRRAAREQAAMINLLGRPDRGLGATVIAHDQPAAFCLPGRGGAVVISSAALATLGPDELAAVLAHERAHQAGHHHLLLAVVEGFADAFGRVPLLRHAAEQVAHLIELLADDTATRDHDRLTLADALVGFAGHRDQPARGVLAAATGALPRLWRLLTPAAPLSRGQRLAALTATVLLAAAPVLMIVLPALATHMVWCPSPMPADLAGACLQ